MRLDLLRQGFRYAYRALRRDTGFAIFVVLIAGLGIGASATVYGLISYSVSHRTQKIGIRMALGASARGVQREIIAQTLRLAAIGMTLGTAAAWALARGMSGLLFDVSETDPAAFLAMLVILTAVAAVAGYVPARRAARIDPMLALRAD